MKKTTLALVALTGSLLAAGVMLAESSSKKAAPAAPAAAPAAQKDQKLARVATLKTIEANREFQANVQILQTQRQAAIEQNTAMEKETNAAKKKEMKVKLDDLMTKLNENNDKMVKAYGFSLSRNYTLITEVAHVYMLVSDEEADKIEKEAAKAEKDAAKK